MRSGDERGVQSEARRRAYLMTLVYAVAVPASGLVAALALVIGARPVWVGFFVVFWFALWQSNHWHANTGHQGFSRAFVSDAAAVLDVPRSLVWAVRAVHFVVLVVVVPTLAIVGIVT
jgi:hypothetical protein